jgi:amidase
MTRAPGGGSPDPECVAAAEAAARSLEALGHDVDVSHPGALDDPERVRAFGVVWAVNAAVAVAGWSRTLGRELGEADLEPLTFALAARGREVSATDFVAAVAAMQSWCRRVAQWWHDGHDLLLTPTVGEPPPPLGTFRDPDDPWHAFVRAGTFTPYTPFANQTGQPAISLPLATSRGGLPIGVQLVARYGAEDVLLRVAAQLEEVSPWASRRPRVHA